MRDLATYESNYSENTGIRSSLLKMFKLVSQTRSKISEKLPQGDNQGWLLDN